MKAPKWLDLFKIDAPASSLCCLRVDSLRSGGKTPGSAATSIRSKKLRAAQTIYIGNLSEMQYPHRWYPIERQGTLDGSAFSAANAVRFIGNEDRDVSPC